MTPEEEVILAKQVEIDKLDAKLRKKQELNRKDETLDSELIYAKKKTLAKILEV